MEKVKGYQCKGNAKIESAGKYYDEGDKMIKALSPNAKAKAIVIVKVTSIYVTSPGRDAGKEIK
jgi:predicted pyridoxine 5'-phosphate oxidase superfamily flavin-nucleotide-binding protein